MMHNSNPPQAMIRRFEALYEATHRQLFAFVRVNCRNPLMVEDIVQECYIRLWKQLEQLQDDDKLLTLLRLYAKSAIIDHLRKEASDKLRCMRYMEDKDLICYGDTPLLQKELTAQYREVIDAMPPQRRRVYLLVRERGLTHQEVSARLNISVHTIERHMNEAMKHLKMSLDGRMWVVVIVIMLF